MIANKWAHFLTLFLVPFWSRFRPVLVSVKSPFFTHSGPFWADTETKTGPNRDQNGAKLISKQVQTKTETGPDTMLKNGPIYLQLFVII